MGVGPATQSYSSAVIREAVVPGGGRCSSRLAAVRLHSKVSKWTEGECRAYREDSTGLIGISPAKNPSVTPLPAPVPLPDALRSRGITDLSEQSLRGALRHRDPAVRSLAANELAAEHFTDALPEIEQALSIEKNPQAEANIAEALCALHDAKGVEHLKTVCADSSLPAVNLIPALRVLQLTQSRMGNCANNLRSAIEREKDNDAKAIPMSFLAPVYSDCAMETQAKISRLLSSLLAEQSQTLLSARCRAKSLCRLVLLAQGRPLRCIVGVLSIRSSMRLELGRTP